MYSRSTLVEWIELPSKLCYSAIHKAPGSLVTGRSQKYRRQERPTEAIPPIDGFMVGAVERWNSTSQIMERPRTVRAGVCE